MSKRIETVVFEVEDMEASAPFWEAFKAGKAIYGMRPFAIGRGDQMTIPSEIAEALRFIDPDRATVELRDIVKLAEKYSDEQIAQIMPGRG